MQKTIKTLSILALSLVFVSGCTHKKVSVTEFDDKNKTCSQLERDIAAMEGLEQNIDDKTGMSGRNVGMALLFWPGIIVNEMNAGDARDRASDRKQHLLGLYDEKNCS